jgi:adenine-specific DNA-methyltransferase
MAIEYLGNKSRLVDFLVEPIRSVPGVTTVADLFCGTASVSKALRRAGKRVIANDHLELCATLAEAALLTDGAPGFESLGIVLRSGESAYDGVLRVLNALPRRAGFFHRTYSPAAPTPRMYLTEANAAKVDAIRAQIACWEPRLTRVERAVLLRDLAVAVTAISNTAGTYGCYLKRWKPRALEALVLAAGSVSDRRSALSHEVWREDAHALASRLRDVDAVYLDPPYTKRQYAAYYHLLETLVAGSAPAVEGSTGLPPWQEKRSAFCYRKRAPGALEQLVALLDAPHVFLSYSDDGHIPHEAILEILGQRGGVRYWELPLARYRSNTGRTEPKAMVRERLYHLAIAG